MALMSWEESVQWLRQQPNQKELVRACYFDDPLIEAAERFRQSTEWQAIAALLPPTKGRILDLGAGRGISSYALANDGWRVTALEPDPSSLVGAGAILALTEEADLEIEVVSEYSEELPFEDNSFDAVNCRQVLHHARDLPQTCQEIYRVLKPGGTMLATREHVISRKRDLQAFLDTHPLHRYYGGENAFLLKEYLDALRKAGLVVKRTMAPLDSPINYYPMTQQQLFNYATDIIAPYLGKQLAKKVFNPTSSRGNILLSWLIKLHNRLNNSPGRLYSFLAEKPSH